MKYIIYEPNDMGDKASDLVMAASMEPFNARHRIRTIHATGASQFSLLKALVPKYGARFPKDVWDFFHLDEYAKLAGGETHKASFRKYLRERIYNPLGLEAPQFVFIDGNASDLEAECNRCGRLVTAAPIDIANIGIGENGHLAFNDPPADFETEEPYIVVDLDEKCRRQQMGEGWFETLEGTGPTVVPKQAISMSIRQIMKSGYIMCYVPDERKAEAVQKAIEGPITNEVPASKLQEHENCVIVLDPGSAKFLKRQERGVLIPVEPKYE